MRNEFEQFIFNRSRQTLNGRKKIFLETINSEPPVISTSIESKLIGKFYSYGQFLIVNITRFLYWKVNLFSQ